MRFGSGKNDDPVGIRCCRPGSRAKCGEEEFSDVTTSERISVLISKESQQVPEYVVELSQRSAPLVQRPSTFRYCPAPIRPADAMSPSIPSNAVERVLCRPVFPCTLIGPHLAHLLCVKNNGALRDQNSAQAYNAGSFCADLDTACNNDVFPAPDRPVTSRPGAVSMQPQSQRRHCWVCGIHTSPDPAAERMNKKVRSTEPVSLLKDVINTS